MDLYKESSVQTPPDFMPRQRANYTCAKNHSSKKKCTLRPNAYQHETKNKQNLVRSVIIKPGDRIHLYA